MGDLPQNINAEPPADEAKTIDNNVWIERILLLEFLHLLGAFFAILASLSLIGSFAFSHYGLALMLLAGIMLAIILAIVMFGTFMRKKWAWWLSVIVFFLSSSFSPGIPNIMSTIVPNPLE